MRTLLVSSFLVVAFLLSAAWTTSVSAQGNAFTVSDGKLEFTAPANWTKKEPASRIVEVEFAVPPAKGDEMPGRLTAMGAGGSIQSNIDRWVNDQFGGTATPKRDKANVSGADIEIVDLSGTYKDSPGGPFAGGKTIMRDNYRMLGAIIQTKDRGNYFLKLYGPKATIDENEKGFQDMVKSLKVK